MPTLLPNIASTIGTGARLIGQLESVRRIIDEKFLAACELLSQSVDSLENLISSLEILAKTLDVKTVESTTSDLMRAAEKLFALPKNQSDRISQVERLADGREHFSERISDMRCSLAYMRAITSAVAKVADDADTSDAVKTFLQDLSGSIDTGTDELKKLEFHLSSLHLGLESILAKRDVLAFQIDQLLPMVPDDLMTNAKVMGNHYLRVVSTAGSVAALARDIHQRVSRLLGALQIGDITRQRIEHIQAGIILIDTNVRLISPENRERVLATLYALLAAQISATSADFHREVSEIGQSMAGMAADARELLRLHDMAYGGKVDTEGGFLKRISDQIDRARDLVAEIETAENVALETVRETAESAQDIAQRIGAIQSLKENFHAIGICGGTLPFDPAHCDERLSAVLDDLSRHGDKLEDAAEKCVGVAKTLAASAADVSKEWVEAGKDGNEARAVADALCIAGARVRDARDKTETDIVSIVAKGDTILNMLEISTVRLDFHTGIGEILDAVSADLNRLGDQAAPYQDENTEQLEAILNRMAKFYSMSLERDLHRSFVRALGIAIGEDPTPVQFESDDFETILF